jgi:hypothetical protein
VHNRHHRQVERYRSSNRDRDHNRDRNDDRHAGRSNGRDDARQDTKNSGNRKATTLQHNGVLAQDRNRSTEKTNDFQQGNREVQSKTDFNKNRYRTNSSSVTEQPKDLASHRNNENVNIRERTDVKERSSNNINTRPQQREQVNIRTDVKPEVKRELRQPKVTQHQENRNIQSRPLKQQTQSREKSVQNRSSNVRQQPAKNSGGIRKGRQ